MTAQEFRTELLPLKDRLYRFALSRVFDHEAARDIVQEVYLKLWTQRERLHTVKNLEAWCIRCTRNLMIDRHRAARLTDELDRSVAPTASDQSDAELLHGDLVENIKNLLLVLPERQQEIFRLRELMGYTNREIGEILDLSQPEVRVGLCRSRKKIKELLKQRIDYGLETNCT